MHAIILNSSTYMNTESIITTLYVDDISSEFKSSTVSRVLQNNLNHVVNEIKIKLSQNESMVIACTYYTQRTLFIFKLIVGKNI